MADRLLQRHDVSDLCIGKPALRWLPPSATVADALAALKRVSSGDTAAIAVWDGKGAVSGKVCMVDVLLFLCADKNLATPGAALDASVTALLAGGAPPVRRVEPNTSVLEAVDAFLDGAHSLVVPIRATSAARRRQSACTCGGELCWLTVEDLVRFFLGSITLFSPTASLSVSALGVIRPATLAVSAGNPALSAVPLLRAALAAHTSVAVVCPSVSSGPRRLAGEISPSTLAACDESVAAAIAALSAGALMAFVDCGCSPPDSAIRALRSRLRHRSLLGMLELLDGEAFSSPSSLSTSSSSCSSSSSDDEDGAKNYSTNSNRSSCNRMRRTGSYAARMGWRAEEAIVCHPGSSLVAVMIQAIAHRVTHVWVVDDDDDDHELVGIVGFVDVLRVLREHLIALAS